MPHESRAFIAPVRSHNILDGGGKLVTSWVSSKREMDAVANQRKPQGKHIHFTATGGGSHCLCYCTLVLARGAFLFSGKRGLLQRRVGDFEVREADERGDTRISRHRIDVRLVRRSF